MPAARSPSVVTLNIISEDVAVEVAMAKRDVGVDVPMPTLPSVVTTNIKSELVPMVKSPALVVVPKAMLPSVLMYKMSVLVATCNNPKAELVPMPTYPSVVMLNRTSPVVVPTVNTPAAVLVPIDTAPDGVLT